MEQFNSPVEEHYYQQGIFEHIVQLLKETGKEKITREDITVVDEFHVRGSEVSLELRNIKENKLELQSEIYQG